MNSLNIQADRIDHLARPGILTEEILGELLRADLVVADLTSSNPNVMYELGVRHAWNKPIILMAPEGELLPFDVKVVSTIFYGPLDDKRACQRAQRALAKQAKHCTSPGHRQSRMLEEAAAEAAQPFAAALIHSSFCAFLESARTGVMLCANELDHEFEPEAQDAFPVLASEIWDVLTLFTQEMWAMQRIASGHIGKTEPDAYLLSLLYEGNELVKAGGRLTEWMSTLRGAKSVSQAAGRLRQFILSIDALAKKCLKSAVLDDRGR